MDGCWDTDWWYCMRIYAAAIEQAGSYARDLKFGVYNSLADIHQHFFVSYYATRSRGLFKIKSRAFGTKRHKITIIVDSGAHTFFGAVGLSATPHIKVRVTPGNPNIYLENYLDWVEANWSEIEFFVELDLQEIVGHEQVIRWRKRYKERGFQSKCILVYHTGDGWNRFRNIVDNNEARFVATEGIRPGKPILPYGEITRYAYEHKCKIHGFAMTRFNLLAKVPFYSVDSSTWKMPARWGKLLTLRPGRGVPHVGQKNPNKGLFLQQRLGLDYLSQDRRKQSTNKKISMALEVFHRMEIDLTALWERRGIHWGN